jgi:hypothetical protein
VGRRRWPPYSLRGHRATGGAGWGGATAAIHRGALGATLWETEPHQRRIPRALLEEAEIRLQLTANNLANAVDFSTQHDMLAKEMRGICCIGAITVYDAWPRL